MFECGMLGRISGFEAGEVITESYILVSLVLI